MEGYVMTWILLGALALAPVLSRLSGIAVTTGSGWQLKSAWRVGGTVGMRV